MKTYDVRARWYDLGSLYSGSDSDSSCMLGDSEDDEDVELGGDAGEPVGFRVEKINQKKRSVPKARRARYDADADEKPMMMVELCEAELEYELESWSEGEGHERVHKQRLEKDEE